MSEYYVTQERAMAPGVSGDWPEVIPKPDNRNGRLVKVKGAESLLERVAFALTHLSGACMEARLLQAEMMEMFELDLSKYDARVPEHDDMPLSLRAMTPKNFEEAEKP